MRLTREEITQTKLERNVNCVCFNCVERAEMYKCRAYCWDYAKWKKKKEDKKEDRRNG